MTSRFRILRHILSRIRTTYRIVPEIKRYHIPTKVYLPCTVGLSLFTLLGFEKQLTAEDELIDTIKHCVLFVQRMEYDKAEQLLHVALRQAQQMQHDLGILYIYDVMANLALERKQLDKAKKLFTEVTQRLLSSGASEEDPRVVHISIKLARICHLSQDYSTAQTGYDWCMLTLKRKLKEGPSDLLNKLLAMTEDWYGRLFLEFQKYEQALEFMINSLNRMKEVPDMDQEHIVVQLNDIGTVLEQMDKTDDSIEYFKEAIDVGTKLDMQELGTMYVNLGRAYLKKNLVAEARKNCGYAWRLGVVKNSDTVKDEAEDCLREIKSVQLTV